MKRSYRQNCALAHALDVIGERWTLLIVRELLIGPRRYNELLENLRGMGTNLLAARLKDMQAQGLIDKDDSVYRLTAAGRQLEPVVWAMVRFGLGLGIAPDTKHLSRPQWDAVALRALYDPSLDPGIEGSYVLELDNQPLTVVKHEDRVSVTADDSDQSKARISMSKATAKKLGSGEMSFDDGVRGGQISIVGNKREAKRLLKAFGAR